MSNIYLPNSTLDGKWSRTNQRFEGQSSKYSRYTESYQPGYVANRRSYPHHDDQDTPSEHVPTYRRFARDEPLTHPMDSLEIPTSIAHASPYRLGNILLLTEGDSQGSYFPLTRKYYRSSNDYLFRDENGVGYLSVHHYLQMKMILFFSGRLPESEPHFQSSEQLRRAAKMNFEKYHDALDQIRTVHDMRSFMGNLKLREFNYDFWYQSQSILHAMTEANMLKFTQNKDLQELLLTNSSENTLFMEVSGFDQCFFGSGYTLEYLEKTRHFYTDRPQLWRGWNNFGESLFLCRKLLRSVVVAVPQEDNANVAGSKRHREETMN